MCAVNRGVLGTQTGSMGGITASNWKGRNVYKQKVPARNSSQTPAQLAQRRKFAALSRLSRLLGPAIRIGYRVAASTVTEQNVFFSANRDAVQDNGIATTVSYNSLEVSQGTVAPVRNLSVVYTAANGGLVWSWVSDPNGVDALLTDQLHIVILNKTTGYTEMLAVTDTRAETGHSVAIQTNMNPADLVAIAFFKRASNTSTSPSVNVQVVAG